MKIAEKNNLEVSGRARLTATVPGTRKYGEDIEIRDSKGDLIFQGYPLIDPGEIVEVKKAKNIIVTVGLQLVGNMLIDAGAQWDTGLTYCAEGTDDTAPVVADTTLGTEAARKAITSRTRVGEEITLSTFFTAAEANDNIKEAGIFGSSTAGAGADSGVLFAHWLTSYDNTGALVDITIDYVLTIG